MQLLVDSFSILIQRLNQIGKAFGRLKRGLLRSQQIAYRSQQIALQTERDHMILFRKASDRRSRDLLRSAICCCSEKNHVVPISLECDLLRSICDLLRSQQAPFQATKSFSYLIQSLYQNAETVDQKLHLRTRILAFC